MSIDDKIQALRDAQHKLCLAYASGNGILRAKDKRDELAQNHFAALIEEIVNLREVNERLRVENDSKKQRISILYERLSQYEDCVGLLK